MIRELLFIWGIINAMYYNGNKLMSHNKLFNMAVGGRSCGKTYWATCYCIKRFLEKGERFIYLRRYKSELKKRDSFFGKVSHEFPNVDLAVGKDGNFKINGEIAGDVVALSTSRIQKSTNYLNVSTILFDEFIIDKGPIHYLPNELQVLFDFYSTVDRLQDKARVIMLSNAISQNNPYFLGMNITPNGQKFIKYKEVVVEIIDDEEFKEHVRSTRFGKFIDGTEYGKFAIDNEFLRDNMSFIEPKPPTAKFSFSITNGGETFGVWIDYRFMLYYVSTKHDPSCIANFVFNSAEHGENLVLLRSAKNVGLTKNLIQAFKLGAVRFESFKVKAKVSEVIYKCMF